MVINRLALMGWPYFLFAAKKIMRLNRFTAFLFLPACDLSRETEKPSKGI